MGWMVQRAASVLLFYPVSQLKRSANAATDATAGADHPAPAVSCLFRPSESAPSTSSSRRHRLQARHFPHDALDRKRTGVPSGRMAMLISFIGLSSAAMRLDERAPQFHCAWCCLSVLSVYLMPCGGCVTAPLDLLSQSHQRSASRRADGFLVETLSDGFLQAAGRSYTAAHPTRPRGCR